MVVVVGDGSVLFTCNWLGRSVLCAEKSSGLNRLEVEKRFFPGTLNAPGTRIYGCQARPRTVQTIPEVPRLQDLLQARSAHAGFDGPNHGYENLLGFDQTCERSREISPDPGTRS